MLHLQDGDVCQEGGRFQPGPGDPGWTHQEAPTSLEEYRTSGYRFKEGDSISVELEYETPPKEDSPPLSPRPVQVPPFPQGPQETYDSYVARSLKSNLRPVSRDLWELLEKSKPTSTSRGPPSTPPPTPRRSSSPIPVPQTPITVRADPVHHPETADQPQKGRSLFKRPVVPPKLRAKAKRPDSLPLKLKSYSVDQAYKDLSGGLPSYPLEQYHAPGSR